jgi:hypothetical protein
MLGYSSRLTVVYLQQSTLVEAAKPGMGTIQQLAIEYLSKLNETT